MTLEVSDLHVGYATATVLHGVDLTVGDGQSVALLGRNGMGKTTLVRSVCGLRPPTVVRGSVVFDGVDITRRSPFQISRAGIAIVPQGRRVFGSLTTTENLTVVPRRRAASAAERWIVSLPRKTAWIVRPIPNCWRGRRNWDALFLHRTRTL